MINWRSYNDLKINFKFFSRDIHYQPFKSQVHTNRRTTRSINILAKLKILTLIMSDHVPIEPRFKTLHSLKIKDIFDAQFMEFRYKFSIIYYQTFMFRCTLYHIETRNHGWMHVFTTQTFGVYSIPDLSYQFIFNVIEKAQTHAINTFSNLIKHHILVLIMNASNPTVMCE